LFPLSKIGQRCRMQAIDNENVIRLLTLGWDRLASLAPRLVMGWWTVLWIEVDTLELRRLRLKFLKLQRLILQLQPVVKSCSHHSHLPLHPYHFLMPSTSWQTLILQENPNIDIDLHIFHPPSSILCYTWKQGQPQHKTPASSHHDAS
jgi:hypothetical protein